jgi:hypothetical protein
VSAFIYNEDSRCPGRRHGRRNYSHLLFRTISIFGVFRVTARIPTPGDKFYEVGEKYVVTIAKAGDDIGRYRDGVEK